MKKGRLWVININKEGHLKRHLACEISTELAQESFTHLAKMEMLEDVVLLQ